MRLSPALKELILSADLILKGKEFRGLAHELNKIGSQSFEGTVSVLLDRYRVSSFKPCLHGTN